MRDWARGPYAEALAEGQSLPEEQRGRIAAQMAAYTGLSPRFILDNDLRVEPSAFRKELLRDRRLTLGRYDARFTGEDAGAGGDAPDRLAARLRALPRPVVGHIRDGALILDLRTLDRDSDLLDALSA